MQANNEQTANAEQTANSMVVEQPTVTPSVTPSLPEKMIKLQPSDDTTKVFQMPYEAACKSLTIKNMLDDLGDDSDIAIPLHNVTTPVLTKVIEYCVFHNENPGDCAKKEDGTENKDEISPWDMAFAEVDQAMLFEMILAANYLDIKPLLDLTCKTVANMIKGKTPEEIRKQFNIKNDFTPEEEEKVRKENEWCEDK